MIPVLDHGYMKLIQCWGSDQSIIEAARMSTAKGFLGWGTVCRNCNLTPDEAAGGACDVLAGPQHDWRPGDEKLLRRLWEKKHATPFEMAGLIVEVQAPIFVFREWHRHRTQSYNEMSARYTPLPDLNYVPTVERLMLNAGTSNKQAAAVADAPALSLEEARNFQQGLLLSYTALENVYQHALAHGVPKELARLVIPVGRYSRMRASANLRNWFQFLTLRSAPDAQWEIRQYADVLETFIEDAFPRTWDVVRGGTGFA